MPPVLTDAEVERIAALAHLELTKDEKPLFARQLGEILAYAELVQQVDTTGVPPTSHVLAGHPTSRPDEVGPSLTRAEALANAPDPDREAGLFKVPRVIA
jgi:aspartyl-tRNA(Asn)/glutamyl-tRNA(Gln) amidotransferase subunit C